MTGEKIIILITALFLSISFNGSGQCKLSGTYQETTSIGQTILKFTESGLFEYEISTCIKKWAGIGLYKVKHDKLILSFYHPADKRTDDAETWPTKKEKWKIIKCDSTELIIVPGDTWYLKKL